MRTDVRARPSIRALAALAALCLTGAAPPVSSAGETAAGTGARAAVERMAGFFADAAAVDGGYVYAYTPDLGVRRGEGGRVDPDVIWNQPPGTPAVGAAFLLLHEITGEPRWLDAARRVAGAVVAGQLVSGGWYNFTRTDPEARRLWCYRLDDPDGAGCAAIDGNAERNRSVLDDNITQSALGFLLAYDRATGGEDAGARAALRYGLDHLLAAQHRNGGWGPFFDGPADDAGVATAWRASLPETWSRSWVAPHTPPYFVINDHLVRDVVRLLLAVERATGDERYLAAAMRSGDFLLAAQLPAPQRGWAQTYDADLQPVWGRRFEPPSVASRETAGAVDALLDLYLRTGKQRYLDGAIAGAGWLRASRRDDGLWARFYELGSNAPLYVAADGSLTGDRTALRPGYVLEGPLGVAPVLARVDRVVRGEETAPRPALDAVFEPTRDGDTTDVLALVTRQADSAGRVVEDGWIRSATFVAAVRALAAAARVGAD